MIWLAVVYALTVPVAGLSRGTLDLRARTWIDWQWDVGCALFGFGVWMLGK